MTLKQQAISGVKWSAVSMGVMTALQFVTLAVLARLLSPEDFGLMGMTMVVVGFAQAFADMGISNAIIHRQDATKDQLSSLYWLNIFAGIIVFCVVCTSTPLVVGFYHEPRLHNLLFLTAVVFLVTPFGQQFQILMQKELRFDSLAKIEIAVSVINSVASITLAFMGFGVYSLIWGQLARASTRVLMLFHWGWGHWRPCLYFSRRDLQGYLSFGLYQMGERAVNYLSANVDYLIIGRLLGSTALGYYTLAYQIAIFPLARISPVITKVVFPIFSMIQDNDSRLRNGYCKGINYISLISFPVMAGMLLVAPEFIRLIYGVKWEPAIKILQILCLVGAFKSLGNPIGSILLSKGRADIGFYWNIIVLASVSIAVIVGANWGIIGVSFAILILQLPLFSTIQPIVNRMIGLRFGQYFRAIQPPLVCSLIMLVITFSVKLILGDFNTLVRFITTVTCGVVVYIVSYYIRDRQIFTEVKSVLKGI